MRTTRHTVIVATLVLITAFVVSPPAAAETAKGATFIYQFDGDRLLELAVRDEIVEARIVYELDGRTIWTQRFLLRADAGDTMTFPVPDPAEMRPAAKTEGALAIHIYVGDILLESFDAASFRAYNRKLIVSQGPELERHLEAWSEEPDAAANGKPTVQAAPPVFEVPSGLEAKVFGGCEDNCMTQYRQCIRYQGSSDCDGGLYWCLLNCPNYDSDSDGVNNGNDNCLQTYNPGQANCDGDAAGDACDSVNGIFQTIIPEKTCWTDKDSHLPPIYNSFEHHVEWKERDVSSCGNPDRWRNRIRDENRCYNVPDLQCCLGLSESIFAVGDSPIIWCEEFRNINLCH